MVHCMKRYCTSVMEAYSDLVCVYGSLYEEVLYQCYGGTFWPVVRVYISLYEEVLYQCYGGIF